MKKVLLLVFMLIFLVGCGKNENELIMVTEAGFAPYEYYDNGEIVGVDVDIANEIAKVFSKEIPELYNISNVNVLDTAEVASSAYNVNIVKQSTIFLLVGLVLGLGVVFVMYYFDRSVKNASQIEDKLKLPVLATVREYRG